MQEYVVLARLYAHLRHRLQIPDAGRLAGQVAERQRSDFEALREAISKMAQRSRGDTQAIVKHLKDLEQAVTAGRQAADGVSQRLRAVAKRQAALQLAHDADRLTLRRIDARFTAPPVNAAATDTAEPPPIAPVAVATADDEWRLLDACPACQSPDAGPVVCEYNRFLVHGTAPEPDFHVYNYTLCRHCGMVFAARRPRGERYRRLLHTFTESLGRMSPGANLLLNAAPLGDGDRDELDRRAAAGVFVSEHAGIGRRDYLPALQRDRLSMAPHVELLGSMLPLQGARVLEVRSRTGALLAILRRLYGAEVMALPIFESQQHVLQRVYGIPAGVLLDFENFRVCHPGPFDLIVSNHMVTHALDPLALLRELRAHVRTGGHLYLYNEPDESECLDLKQSMFRILNPFHMQTFDRASLLRLLARAGFEPVYVGHTDSVYLNCLMRATEPAAPDPLPEDDFRRRLAAYGRARDIAILQSPEPVRALFGGEWQAALERASVAGLVDMDERGRLHFEN